VSIPAAGLVSMPAVALFAGLAAGLAAMQLACCLIARSLRGAGVRLRWWVALTGICLPLAVLSPWWAGGLLLVPTPAGVFPGPPQKPGPHAQLSDTTYQFLPWEAEVRRAVADGHLPLWSDRLDGGSSPWVNPQAQAVSPVAWLARCFPLRHFLLAALALKLLVAYEGTVLLAQRLSASRLAAALAGLAFSLGGGLMAWALFAHTAAAAWVPWVVLSLVCTVRSRRTGAWIGACATVALLMLAGHPEVALAGLALAVLAACWYRRPGRSSRSGLARAAAAVVLGVCLSAVQIVPFAIAARQSQRSEDQQNRPPSQFAAFDLWPSSWFAPASVRFWLAPLGPEVFGKAYEGPFRGPWDWPDALSGYAGLVALAGAGIAVFSSARRKAAPLLIFALAALALASELAPFERLALAVPLLRVPAYQRALLVSCLALAVAGALGIDRLRRLRRLSLPHLGAAGVAAAALWVDHSPTAILLWVGIALGFAVEAGVGARAGDGAGARVGAGAGARAGAGAGAGLCRRRLGISILLAVTVLDLVPWSQRLLPRGDAALFFPRASLVDRLLPLAGDAIQGRAVGAGMMVYPAVLPAYGVAEVRPNNPLAPRAYVHVLDWAFGFRPGVYRYYSPFEHLDHPLLDFLGVRAVVSNRYLANPPRLQTVHGLDFKPYLLLTNPRALPRAFFPRTVELVARPRLEAWVRGLRDGAAVALDPEQDTPAAPGRWPGGFAIPSLSSSRPGAVAVTFAPAAEDRLLATSFLADGWRARTGGRALTTRTVDGCFLGVLVPAGAAAVELRYLPPGFLLGAAATALAAALILGGGLALRRAPAAPGSARGPGFPRRPAAR